MSFSNLEELDTLLNKLISRVPDTNAFLQSIYTDLGNKDSLERLLRIVFEKPMESVKVLSKHLRILNTYGTFLIKAYSIALLLSDEKRIVLNPVILINELYRPHYLVSLYNPLVLTYLYVNHRPHYEHSVLKTLLDQHVIHEFNPVNQFIYLYRDFLFHVSLRYEEFVSSLYGNYGLRNTFVFRNFLQDINVDIIALSFKNYLRLISSLLDVLKATVYAYEKSNLASSSDNLSENLLSRIQTIRNNYRYLVSTSINKLFSLLNAMLDLEGRFFKNSLIKLFEILLSEREIFMQSRYEILVFVLEAYRFKDSNERIKALNYSATTNLSLLVDNLVSIINNTVCAKGYVDSLREILYRDGEPFSTLRKKILGLGVPPEWLKELIS